MKSCLGLLIVLLVFVAVVGGGFLIWYLSDTAEFSRKPSPAAQGAPPPRAVPVKPQPPKPR
jgi:hypothetical protein